MVSLLKTLILYTIFMAILYSVYWLAMMKFNPYKICIDDPKRPDAYWICEPQKMHLPKDNWLFTPDENSNYQKRRTQ